MESRPHDTHGTESSASTSTSNASFSSDSPSDSSGLADRARGVASTAGDKLADAGTVVRERAGSLKNTIADALESGADRLRQQAPDDARLGGAMTAGGATAVTSDTRLSQASSGIAGGMQGAADWLRDMDIDGLKSGIERQVKEHPGRTLAMAVGLGYLLGKAFRK